MSACLVSGSPALAASAGGGIKVDFPTITGTLGAITNVLSGNGVKFAAALCILGGAAGIMKQRELPDAVMPFMVIVLLAGIVMLAPSVMSQIIAMTSGATV